MGAICKECNSVQKEAHFKESGHTKHYPTGEVETLRRLIDVLREDRASQDGEIEDLTQEIADLKNQLAVIQKRLTQSLIRIEDARRAAAMELEEADEKLRKAYHKIRTLEGW